MGATFIVTLREGFEAALLLGIVYTYLDKVAGRVHYRWVTLGALAGAAASVLAGVAVSFLSGPLLDLGPDVVATAVMLIAVVVLTWHGWWMRQHSRGITTDVQRRIDEAQVTRRLWIVGLIAFTGVFREGAETVLFLWGLMSQATISEWGGLGGGVLGLGAAAVLGWLVFRGGKHISLSRFFTGTSILLLLVAAGLFASVIGKLESFGFLPSSATIWDTSFLLSDDGVIGGFLRGLVGYRARPSVFEALGYGGYLVLAGILFFGPEQRRPRIGPSHRSERSDSPRSEGALTPS